MKKYRLLRIPRILNDSFSEFRRQADLRLGRTDPLGAVTLFDAKELGESVEEVTLVHERTHQTLFRLTALGHLTNCLWQFVQAGHYKQEYDLFLREQTTIQELTAYYVSLSWSARRSAAEYEATWSKTLKKYQSLVEPVLSVLPLKGVSDNKRILARAHIVEAVARSAFNSECLRLFSDPDRLNVDAVREYLSLQSTHLRFASILNSLIVSPGLDALEGQVLDFLTPLEEKEMADEGLKWLLWTIPSIVPSEIFVANVEQILAQLFQFAEGWKEKAQTLNVQLSMPRPSIPSPEIVRSPDYMDLVRQQVAAPHKVREEVLQLLFDLATPDRAEIYLWIYMNKQDEVFLTVFWCGADSEGRPKLDAFARFDSDVVEGVMDVKDVFRALDRAPRGSIVAIFYKSSWLHWNVASNKKPFMAFAKTGCIEVDLTEESLALILAFQKFYQFDRGSSWFGSDLGVEMRMAYLVSAERPDAFAILRLGSKVAAKRFFEFVTREKIPASTPDLVRHKRMLEVAAIPVWGQVIRDNTEVSQPHHSSANTDSRSRQ